MIYAVNTPKGLGIELWGTKDDLDTLYNVVGNFWNEKNFLTVVIRY